MYSNNLGHIGAGASSTSSTAATANVPIDPLLTAAGDNNFSLWDSQQTINVQLGATVSPSGKMDGVKLTVDAHIVPGQTQVLGWMGKGIVLPFDNPALIIYAKKGSGATIGNAFGFWNMRTASAPAFVYVDYDNVPSGAVVGGEGASGSVAIAKQGWIQVTVIPPKGSLLAGDLAIVYPGWNGPVSTPGDFNYVYCARLVNTAVVNALDVQHAGIGGNLTRMEKIALAGIGIGLLMRHK